jgi:hypothetical protein
MRSIYTSHRVSSLSVVRGISPQVTSQAISMNERDDIVSMFDLSRANGHVFSSVIYSGMNSREYIVLFKSYFNSKSESYKKSVVSDYSRDSQIINVSKMFSSSKDLNCNPLYKDHISFLFCFHSKSYNNGYNKAKFDVYNAIVNTLRSEGVNINLDDFILDPLVRNMERSALISFCTSIEYVPNLAIFVNSEFLNNGKINAHEIGDHLCLLNQIRCVVSSLPFNASQDGSYPFSDLKVLSRNARGDPSMLSLDFKNLSISSNDGINRSLSNWSGKPYNILSLNVSNLDTVRSNLDYSYRQVASLAFRNNIQSSVHVWSSFSSPFFSSESKNILYNMILERRLKLSTPLTSADIDTICSEFFSTGILKPITINFNIKFIIPSHQEILSEISSLKQHSSSNPELLFNKSDYSNVFGPDDL